MPDDTEFEIEDLLDEVVPPASKEVKWASMVQDTLDDYDGRLAAVEKRTFLLTLGVGLTALGVVAVGRTAMKILVAMQEVKDLVGDLSAVPQRAVEEARVAQQPTEKVEDTVYVPPNEKVVAPTQEPHDPGPMEAPEWVKNDLKDLDLDIPQDPLH